MSWYSPPGAYGSAEPLFLLLIALAIEAYVGDRRLIGTWSQAPRHGLAALVRDLQRRLDRPQRSRRVRSVRGWIAVVFVLLLTLAAGLAVWLFTRHYPFGWILELLLLTTLLAQRRTWVRANAVLQALEGGSLGLARAALPRLTGRSYSAPELHRLDSAAIVRGSLAGVAERTVGDLVAPTFWFALLGPPGLFMQQGLRVAAAGRHAKAAGQDRPEAAYGRAAVICERIAVALPDRLAGLMVAAAALFVPGASAEAAVRHLSWRGAWTPVALGAALRPRGEDEARFTPALLRPALFLFVVACLINAGLVALIALLRLAL